MIAASMLFLYNIFYIITQSFMTEYIRTKETQIWQDQLLELYSGLQPGVNPMDRLSESS